MSAAVLHEPQLEPSQLLSSREVARYVAEGILRFDALVPAELNQRVMAAFAAGTLLDGTRYRGDVATAPRPYSLAVWSESDPLREVFALPRVRGAIHSLLGPAPLVDHPATPGLAPQSRGTVDWHPDGEMELREDPDLMVMYFPHDTPREMGGTMVLPGSHLHTVRCQAASRYDNYVGQRAMVCPAGTIALLHPSLWHCGQPNRSDRQRLMYKIRLCPGPRPGPTWNTDDLHDPDIARTLVRAQDWEAGDHQVGVAQRLAWWRRLSGRADLDIGCWMVRQEHRAGRPPVRVTRHGGTRP
jgi:hypothetical protein